VRPDRDAGVRDVAHTQAKHVAPSYADQQLDADGLQHEHGPTLALRYQRQRFDDFPILDVAAARLRAPQANFTLEGMFRDESAFNEAPRMARPTGAVA
jgi:hypothetical protein